MFEINEINEINNENKINKRKRNNEIKEIEETEENNERNERKERNEELKDNSSSINIPSSIISLFISQNKQRTGPPIEIPLNSNIKQLNALINTLLENNEQVFLLTYFFSSLRSSLFSFFLPFLTYLLFFSSSFLTYFLPSFLTYFSSFLIYFIE